MQSRLAIFGGAPVITSVPDTGWPRTTQADVDVVAEMVRRGELSYTGRRGTVEQLEDKARDYFGVDHSLATTSGTAALHCAYVGLGLEPGDEVIAPTYTFLATVMPIFAVNAVPVLVDADPDTGLVDVDRIEAAITPRTRAIVVVHLNGYPVDMDAVLGIARKHHVAVVEDCSQAHGAECNGTVVGSIGDVSAFSLQSKKVITAGEGGLMLTRHRRIHERAIMLGYALDRCMTEVTDADLASYAGTGFGLNYRMHPLAAALACGAFDRMDDVLDRRNANFEYLDKVLADVPGIQPPVTAPHQTRLGCFSYQPLFRGAELGDLPIERFVEAAIAEGVPLSRPKSPPVHCQAVFTNPSERMMTTYGHFGRGEYRTYAPGDLPASLQYVATALRLPVYSDPQPSFFDAIAEALTKVASGADELHRAAR